MKRNNAPHLLLQLSARPVLLPEQFVQFVNVANGISDWDELLSEADFHGITTLLHSHLEKVSIILPHSTRLKLHLTVARQKKISTVYYAELSNIIQLFQERNIDVLALKGCALAHTIYRDYWHRPLRDIDLLIQPSQIDKAQKLLIDSGFSESNSPIPADHYHKPPLYKISEGVPICVELHSGLFPNCPPWYDNVDFDELMKSSKTISINDVNVQSLGDEDMFWHIFEHGIHMPLVYESYKLKAVADLIGLVEIFFQKMDWGKVSFRCPGFLTRLQHLDQVTSIDSRVMSSLGIIKLSKEISAGQHYIGWPHLRWKEQQDRSFFEILRYTLIPPKWWRCLYYGYSFGLLKDLKCLFWSHPRHILWWGRLYWNLRRRSGM